MQPPDGARQVRVASVRLRRWLDGFAQRHGGIVAQRHGGIVAQRHGGIVAEHHGGTTHHTSPDVVVLAGADGARAWIEVPFGPLAASSGPLATSSGPTAASGGPTAASGDPTAASSGPPAASSGPIAPSDELLAHVERDRRVGVLLVRRGGHAAGVFDGARLLDSKVGSSYVQGSTKAGGWSQQRYARRRANQAGAAFAAAADAAARVLAGEALDALVLGGDRAAVDAVLDDRRLTHLRERVTGPWLEVKDPRQRVLVATPEQFLTVAITLVP